MRAFTIIVIFLILCVSYACADNKISGYDELGGKQITELQTGIDIHWDASGCYAPVSTSSVGGWVARSGALGKHFVIRFDEAVHNEKALCVGRMPANYGGGTMTVTFELGATTATSGDVVLGAQFMRIEPDVTDIDTDSFDTAKEATVTLPGTAGVFTQGTITFTSAEADDLAAGERFLLMFYRAGDDASDTASGDAEIRGLSLTE